MASSLDTFDDLNDLITEDELDETFAKAARHLQTIQANLQTDSLLILYGYYKQGLEGVCNIAKPSWYDMRGKTKWEAWHKLGDLAKEEAKALYVQTLKDIDPDFDPNAAAKPKDSWVTVSTLQSQLSEDDKTIRDYIQEDNLVKVTELLKIQENPINSLDSDGLGLIHWASDRGSLQILELLLAQGALVNLCDFSGQTALHYAASCAHKDCVQFLLKNGGDVTIKDLDNQNVFDVSDDIVKDFIRSCIN